MVEDEDAGEEEGGDMEGPEEPEDGLGGHGEVHTVHKDQEGQDELLEAAASGEKTRVGPFSLEK